MNNFINKIKKKFRNYKENLPVKYTSMELLGFHFGMLTPKDDETLGAWVRGDKPIPPAMVEELDLMLNLIQPDTDILDAGANIGLYSILFALKQPTAKIIAFEPDPINYAFLVLNLEINKINNVIPFNLALWNDNKFVKVFHNRSNPSDSRTIEPKNFDLGEKDFEPSSFLIQCVNPVSFLPKAIEKTPSFSVVKIDTQGADLHILEAVTPMLANGGHVVVEFSPYHLSDANVDADGITRIFSKFKNIEKLNYTPTWNRSPISIKELISEFEAKKTNYSGYFDLLITN
jgi:FkbM family methyltransferase